MNRELQTLYQEDQADRNERRPGTAERDRARLQRVEELLAAGIVQAPEDYYHAAMIFHHAFRAQVEQGTNREIPSVRADQESLRRVWTAHELALRAAELGYAPARWLAAAAYDRWLMGQNRPQKYGTQQWGGALWAIDPATTDAERVASGVRPLAELRPGESSSLA